MSKVVDIAQLRKEFEEKTKAKDLKVFAESQYNLIEKLVKDLEIAQAKVKQLETTLSLLSKKNLIEKVTPEEMICIEQIAALKTKSATRDLTLEETKKLDILIKSLKIIREENPKDTYTPSSQVAEEDDLVAIAAGKTSNK